MIDREQLAEALGRLPSRDREILDRSLHRRMSDEDVAEGLGEAPGDVMGLRKAAIDVLSSELGVQGGFDLGDMLKGLLEPETWELLRAAKERGPASAAEVESGPSSVEAGAEVEAESEPESESWPGLELEPEPEPELEAEPELGEPEAQPELEEPDPAQEPEAEPRPDAPAVRDELGVAELPARRRTANRVGAILALLVAAGGAALLAIAYSPGDGGAPASARPFKPKREAVGDGESTGRHPVALVREATVLRKRPEGKVNARIAPRTAWGSPRVLGVVERRGRWLAVLAPELENGEVGWIEEDDVERLDSVSWALHVDLSKRRLVVRHRGEAVRRLRIGVGREGHETPTGRYAVTDTLDVSKTVSPYNCCVLALTGHQTRLPAGWPGGDRLAVHATDDLSALGKAVSLGCMRTDPRDARWMLERIPLGAPVFVRS